MRFARDFLFLFSKSLFLKIPPSPPSGNPVTTPVPTYQFHSETESLLHTLWTSLFSPSVSDFVLPLCNKF